jgi:integrase
MAASGSIRLERGKQWVLRRRIDGREHRLPLGSIKDLPSRKQARDRADERLAAMQAGPGSRGERITLERFAPFFLEKVCSQKKEATRQTYASAFRMHLVPTLGKKALADITERDLTHLVADLEAAGKKPGTVRHVLMVLTHALNRARSNGYAAASIDLKGLALYRKREIKTERRIFSMAEVGRILAAAELPWRSLYALLAYTGMRGGEALGLTWASIDLPNRCILLKQAAYMGRLQTTKTASSATPLHIVAPLAAHLEAHRAFICALDELVEPPPADLLFPSPRDRTRPYWTSGVRDNHFSPLLEELAIVPAGLHAFRHTYCTELLRMGKPVGVVQKMMRHADIKSTMSYVHVTLEEQRRAGEDFAAVIGSKPGEGG